MKCRKLIGFDQCQPIWTAQADIGRYFSQMHSDPLFFYVSAEQLFENTVEKEEIACKQAISLFSTVFPTALENFTPFSSNLKLSSANSFSLEERTSKMCRLGMG